MPKVSAVTALAASLAAISNAIVIDGRTVEQTLTQTHTRSLTRQPDVTPISTTGREGIGSTYPSFQYGTTRRERTRTATFQPTRTIRPVTTINWSSILESWSSIRNATQSTRTSSSSGPYPTTLSGNNTFNGLDYLERLRELQQARNSSCIQNLINEQNDLRYSSEQIRNRTAACIRQQYEHMEDGLSRLHEQEREYFRNFTRNLQERDERSYTDVSRVLDFLGSLNSTARNFSREQRDEIEERVRRNLRNLVEEVENRTFVPREIKPVFANEHFIRINSESVSNSSVSRLVFLMDTLGFPNYRYTWMNLLAGGDEDAKTGFTFRVGFLKLVETNGTIPLDESKHVLNFFAYSSKWSPLKVDLNSNRDGTSYYTISTKLRPGDEWEDLEIELNFHVAGSVVPLGDGSVIRPNTVKYGLEIKHFPYSLQNGALNLVHGIFASSGVLPLNGTIGIGATGSFAWDPSVFVDGRVGLVTQSEFREAEASIWQYEGDLSNSAGEGLFELALKFPEKADLISWDPDCSFNEQQALVSQQEALTAEALAANSGAAPNETTTTSYTVTTSSSLVSSTVSPTQTPSNAANSLRSGFFPLLISAAASFLLF